MSGGSELAIPLGDGGRLAAELFLPSGPGPHSGVLVLHESFGLNDDIRRIAARFVREGYAALAPDLFSHGSRTAHGWRRMLAFFDEHVRQASAGL